MFYMKNINVKCWKIYFILLRKEYKVIKTLQKYVFLYVQMMMYDDVGARMHLTLKQVPGWLCDASETKKHSPLTLIDFEKRNTKELKHDTQDP